MQRSIRACSKHAAVRNICLLISCCWQVVDVWKRVKGNRCNEKNCECPDAVRWVEYVGMGAGGTDHVLMCAIKTKWMYPSHTSSIWFYGVDLCVYACVPMCLSLHPTQGLTLCQRSHFHNHNHTAYTTNFTVWAASVLTPVTLGGLEMRRHHQMCAATAGTVGSWVKASNKFWRFTQNNWLSRAI